jgi:hypothetical protein
MRKAPTCTKRFGKGRLSTERLLIFEWKRLYQEETCLVKVYGGELSEKLPQALLIAWRLDRIRMWI